MKELNKKQKVFLDVFLLHCDSEMRLPSTYIHLP